MTAAGALRPLPVYYAAKPPVVEPSLDFPCNSQGLCAPVAISAAPAAAPCGCGRQPGRASRPWRSGFLPPLRLQAAAGVRRGFPLRFLCAPFLALSPSAWFGPPIQRESRGGASRARKSAVSGQQSAFWHGASPSWGAPERFHRESNSPTWVFLGRGHPPASREGELCARARFRGQKSKIFAHGAALVRTARA